MYDQWFLWSGSRPMYNSLCADMVMWKSTLVGKITLHKMHDSELEVCPLSKDQETNKPIMEDIELPVPDTTQVTA